VNDPQAQYAFYNTQSWWSEQETQSVLYKYSGNGTFAAYQTLWSSSNIGKLRSFQVGSFQFVALPFFSDGTTNDYRCELLIFNEATQLLVSTQNISTFGVVGVAAITAQNGATYLAVSNFQNQAGSYNVPSYIMRYNNASKRFEHFQNVTTHGAMPPEFCPIGSDIFLAIPNQYDGTSYSQTSVIYKLDSTLGTFTLNQSILTSGATHMKPWARNSQVYLSVVNSIGCYTDIFVFNSTQGQFVTIGGRLNSFYPQWADVTVVDNTAYMAVGPWVLTNSGVALIYQWNGTSTRFELTQQVSVMSLGWYNTHFFTIGVDTFLALANRIYRFCGGSFLLT
jgi:hypothetical protein